MKSSDAYLQYWPAVEQAWVHGSLGQALIVTGPPAASRELAAGLARTLTCERDATVLCACRACTRPLDAHPDIARIEPDKGKIRREHLQGVLQTLNQRPLWSVRRVIWLAQADRMTEPTQNYLLKSLEEPPSYVTFILETSQPRGLLDTVASRCQVMRADTTLVPRPIEDGFDPQAVFEPKAFTAEGVIGMGYWARRQYLHTGAHEYLTLWEAAFMAFRHLESNGNADLGQEVLWNAYRHVPR